MMTETKETKKAPPNEFEDVEKAVESGELEEVKKGDDLDDGSIVLVHPEIVDDGEESTILRKRILELRDSVEDANFQLAEDLYVVYANSFFKKWDFPTWEEYCENEVGIGVRKANYLKKIWEWFAVENNDEALLKEIQKLGWTRAMMLTGLVNNINKERWLPAAKQLSCKKLEDKIKEFKKDQRGKIEDKADGKLDVKHRLNVELYNEQVVTVDEALARAGELANTKVKGQQLVAVCQDFMATNEWMKDPKKNLQAYFAKFENILGVKMVVVNPKTSDVVYGKAFLSDIQKDADSK